MHATLLMIVLSATASAADPSAAMGPAGRENLDRGLVAVQVAPHKVYLSWRLLASDPDETGFAVYRRTGSAAPRRLNQELVRGTTDFVDTQAVDDKTAVYFVRAVVRGREGPPSAECRPLALQDPPCLRFPLQDRSTTFQKVGIADLDGDGWLDFVIKEPNENIDPYELYWKPSPGTYKLAAYRHDGQFLWQYDLGWAIERGIWYSPYVVYDLDGDGRAEVAVKTGEGDPRGPDGRVQKGPEYLTILDGRSGKPLARADWPSRADFPSYNYASRNQLGVAFLDGKTPALLVQRGTYNYMVLVAYQYRQGKLRQLWQWDNRNLSKTFWGQGAHWMHSADVDADGREEVILGSVVIDDNGKALWSTGLGHPDHCYVGDIDPLRPGLEIYYGIETRQRKGNGMCLVEAATGKILWGHDGPTRHVHSRGMCADIDPAHPGSECYSADTDAKKQFAWARLRTAQGKVISEENLGGFGALCAWWDADPQRELILGNRIQDYRGTTHTRIEGQVIAVADVLGDWREEIITSVPGELRIYLTTIPAADRRTCLMQDPIYRADVIHAAMGYYQVPMTSYDLASRKPR